MQYIPRFRIDDARASDCYRRVNSTFVSGTLSGRAVHPLPSIYICPMDLLRPSCALDGSTLYPRRVVTTATLRPFQPRIPPEVISTSQTGPNIGNRTQGAFLISFDWGPISATSLPSSIDVCF